MNGIRTVDDIVRLLVSGFEDWKKYGHVRTVEQGDLVLFDYTSEAQFEAKWTEFEKLSRGLIINKKTGEIVARPFDKFFNWGEGGRISEGKIREILKKEDGSLGISYWVGDEIRVATRGSFTSEQALWASEFIKKYDLRELPRELTLLFEIIYPENQIVVDYQGREDLILLGVRNRFTGEDYFFSRVAEIAQRFGFSLPETYNFSSIEEMLERAKQLSHNEEGWVVRFEDGERYKIKGDAYVAIHRLVFGISERRLIQMWFTGELDEYLAGLPESLRERYSAKREQIAETVANRLAEIKSVYESLPPIEDRKEFVKHIQEHHPTIWSYLLNLKLQRSITRGIIKEQFGVETKHLDESPHLLTVNA